MRTKTTILLFIFTSVFFKHVFSKDSNNGINFVKSTSFSEISELAYQEGKPVFIDFTARWCLHCREMERGIFRNRQVADYMNKEFINYKVNVDRDNGEILSLLYNVRELPTMVFVMPNGDILLKTSGLFTEKDFMEAALEAKSRYDAELEFLRLFSSYLPEIIFRDNSSNDYRPKEPEPILPLYFIPEEEEYVYARSYKVMRF